MVASRGSHTWSRAAVCVEVHWGKQAVIRIFSWASTSSVVLAPIALTGSTPADSSNRRQQPHHKTKWREKARRGGEQRQAVSTSTKQKCHRQRLEAVTVLSVLAFIYALSRIKYQEKNIWKLDIWGRHWSELGESPESSIENTIHISLMSTLKIKCFMK